MKSPHIYYTTSLGELAQVLDRAIKWTIAKPIQDASAQKMIDKFSIPHVKYRQSNDLFGNPILVPKTVSYGKPTIDAPDQGLRTTKMTSQHGSSSQSKTSSVDAMTYVYIGVGAVGLLLATGGVIFLMKWIHKKKSLGRVIDVDSS